MTDVLTFGETMALLTPHQVGLLRHADSLAVGIAGAESNVAIGLARLGASVRWIGRVGDDEFGRLITMTLRGEGVDVRAVVDPDGPTALMLKEQRMSRATRVVYYRAHSAGSRLSPADVDVASIAAARVLHVSGITAALSASARDAVLTAVAHARAAGVLVSLDVNHRSALWDAATAVPVYRELVAASDIVFATEAEASMIVDGSDAVSLARALSGLGPSAVIVKRGSLGAAAVIDGQDHVVPPIPVTAIDSVGAGDAFAAGYLAGLCADESPEACLALAARTGAFAVTVRGDWEGAPTRDELVLLDAAPDEVAR
ncbi:sugar kinase [Cnuibacter physcomitrellae]|uniref:sugar kinase n=1 Tax=Cnuibacter physcomitrellae TaxID=1619308 RepID=UPI002175999E|nr:sugar kinase [Cnuibacter physcomitrellae]MCS5497608.1 sugar kinase [Cnuibacter physcomitrellae]